MNFKFVVSDVSYLWRLNWAMAWRGWPGRGRGRGHKIERGRKATWRPVPIRFGVLVCHVNASVAVAVMLGLWKVFCRCKALLFGRRFLPPPSPQSPPLLRGWKPDISSASEKWLPGVNGNFFGRWTPSKRGYISTPEFTRFLCVALLY